MSLISGNDITDLGQVGVNMSGNGVTVDFSELKKFSKNLEKLKEEKCQQLALQCTDELGSKLLAKTVSQSLTAHGELQRSWKLSPARFEKNACLVSVFNDSANARAIEYGYESTTDGRVKGQFMMTTSAAEIKSDAAKIVEPIVIKFLERYFYGK